MLITDLIVDCGSLETEPISPWAMEPNFDTPIDVCADAEGIWPALCEAVS